MPPDTTATEDEGASRAGAALYREFLADREDVLRHKWLMSEKEGRDVGFEAALVDWVRNHRGTDRKRRQGKKSEG